MDDKARRRNTSRVLGRQYKQAKKYGRKVWKFLQANRSKVLTCFLLGLLGVLLFGIFSLLPAPVTNPAPSGVTTLDFSTFMKQVQAGNMLAVTIQGEDVNGLLAAPLSQNGAPLHQSSTSIASDIAVWSHYMSGSSTYWTSSSSPSAISPARTVYMHVPTGGNAFLMSTLLGQHVVINTLPVAQYSSLLMWLWKFVPIILIVVLLLVFFASRNNSRSTRGVDDRFNQMGKSRARRFERSREISSTGVGNRKSSSSPGLGQLGPSSKTAVPRVNLAPPTTFADVAGIDEVRAELSEIVQFLSNPERFDRLGARIPRGALLVGPPGTGKTLLARAVAGEAGVPFFSISASEFVEMFVGVGASRVRDLFNQARQSAPCVIFIDEIDAVGRKRSTRLTSNDERDQTLNQLLVELDGFDPRQAVVVLAATNRVDILDKALLRPGRFDRRITVSMPDRVGREAILKVHTRETPLHEEVSLERLARLTTGMTGAELANLVNEAALIAARDDRDCVDHDCFEDALARVQLGALRPIVMNEKERRIIAVHEGGHALVAYHLPEADRVNRVTILPRGQSLGVTQFTCEEDRYNYSRETLMARIAVGLGGRVAEELTFGPDKITTGAENDLQVVTDLARRMVTRWGMSEQVGVVFADYQAGGDYALNMSLLDPDAIPSQFRSLVADANGRLLFNGAELPALQHRFAMSAAPGNANGVVMNALIDAEVQRILNDGYVMARNLLTEYNHQLVLLADALIEHEQLDRGQFERLLTA